MALGLLLSSLGVSGAQSREPRAESPKPIQDNSFLLEEAYNQEAAVIQHISGIIFDRKSSSWAYSFTDEWPVNGQRHQLSLTVPVSNVSGIGTGLGDVALNYRLQLVGSGETRVAVAPRLTLLFPTTSSKFGKSDFGIQGALASSTSFLLPPSSFPLVLHSNAGFTYIPSSASGSLLHFNLGQSAIWLVHPHINLMFEAVLENVQSVGPTGASTRSTGYTLSPGVRWSHDFDSMGGLQIVPGIAFPIGYKASAGEKGVLVYLSFEHEFAPLKRR